MNHIRTILLFTCSLLAAVPLFAQQSTKSFQIDSMMVKLSNTADKLERLDILTDLSDLASGSKDVSYSRILWNESIDLAHNSDGDVKAQALKAASAAMIKMSVYHLDNKTDSLEYYFDLARRELSPNDAMRIPAYYSMIRDVRLIQGSDLSKIKSILDNLINDAGNVNQSNKYEELARLYKLAVAVLMIKNEGDSLYKSKMQSEFERYSLQFYEKAKVIPLDEDFLFYSQSLILLQNTYEEDDRKYLEINKLLLDTYEKCLQLPDMKKRKFYSQRARIRCLATFADSKTTPSHERDDYYKRFVELINRYPAQSPSPPYEYYLANISSGYYELKGEYAKVVDCIDTVMKYTPYQSSIADCLERKAKMLAKIGDYKGAYEVEQSFAKHKDSVYALSVNEQYYSLLDQYNVNETKLQQIESEKKYQNIIIISAVSFLLVVIILLIYVYRLWRKAQQSDEMKSSFINSMCHEFRTPINVISGFAQILAEPGSSEEERDAYLTTIHSNVKMLVNMLDDMLNIANVNSNSGKFTVENVDVHSILQDEMSRAYEEFPNKKIDYMIEPTEGSLIISSNKFYFRSIISNVINNTFKFSDKEGSVLASCSMDEPRKNVLISISDHGKGIPLDKHKYVFERFTKIDDYTQGAGLGLYVCKLLVSMLGGRISIDSKYTGGTKIDIVLPAKK